MIEPGVEVSDGLAVASDDGHSVVTNLKSNTARTADVGEPHLTLSQRETLATCSAIMCAASTIFAARTLGRFDRMIAPTTACEWIP